MGEPCWHAEQQMLAFGKRGFSVGLTATFHSSELRPVSVMCVTIAGPS
jgi:hypothetical protein